MPRIRALAANYAADDFRKAVRVARAEVDMTQAELASRMGIAPGTLIERLRKPEKLTVENLRKMCKALPLGTDAVAGLIQIRGVTSDQKG